MKKVKLLSADLRVSRVTSLEVPALRIEAPRFGREVDGSSPPEIFVGRFGYPRVFVGPLIPPLRGRTEDLALTERWFGRSLEEIVSMRVQLLRGKRPLRVTDVDGRYALELREALLSSSSVDMEAKLSKEPRGAVISEEIQPYGPSAPIERLRVYQTGSSDHRLERAYYDTDLKSQEAVLELYASGVPVSRIQQALSAGLLGVRRRFVPTRWSITAVDDMISKRLIEEIKDRPPINEYRLYYGEYLNNRWAVIMFPSPWSYESIEVWFPRTLTDRIALAGDYEPYEGRKEYASMGGCYYAGRLAVAEALSGEGRQASVLILREVHPGYIPVGVWNVRETLRNLLKRRPMRFETLGEVLSEAVRRLTLPLRFWIENSVMLRKLLFQRTLENFLK